MPRSQVPPAAQPDGALESSDPGPVQGLLPFLPGSLPQCQPQIPHALQHFLSFGFLGFSHEVS